jgi:hypothetical protein
MPGDLSEVVLKRVLQIAERRGWEVNYRAGEEGTYLLRHDQNAAQLTVVDGAIHADGGPRREEFERMLREALDSVQADVRDVPFGNAPPLGNASLSPDHPK